MIVSKAELEELQGVTEKRIQDLERKPSDDFSAKFILQTLDSNITLILNSSAPESTVVELGTRDSIVTEALVNYRAEIAQKHAELAYAGEIAYYANEALKLLEKIQKAVPQKEINLYNNIGAKLSLVEPQLKDLASFLKTDKVVSKLRKKDISLEINPEYKSVVFESESKDVAKKAPAKKSVEKTSAKSAATKTAAKTTGAKSSSDKSTAAKSTAAKKSKK